MKGLTINELEVGRSESMTKTVSEYDVYAFAGLTGDFNPAHIDAVAAEKGMFKGRIAHGMLSAGFISAVIGMKLPGAGTIYLSQDLKFTKPVRMGDTITATVTVSEVQRDRNIAKLETVCSNQLGDVVIKGFATVMPPKAV